MKYFSINIVIGDTALDEDSAEGRMQRSLNSIEMLMQKMGLSPELIMFTEVDKEWVDNIHAQLDEADEEE